MQIVLGIIFVLICFEDDLIFILFFRDVTSVAPSNTLLDEIAFLQSEKKPEDQAEPTTDPLPLNSERKLSSQSVVEETAPPRPDRKQEIAPPRPDRKPRSPVTEEEIPPPKPERKAKNVRSIERNPSSKSETRLKSSSSAEGIAEVIIKSKSHLNEEEQPPPKPVRTFQSLHEQDNIPPPKPERKPKSPAKQEDVIISDQSNHSKPDIPAKPSVPPKVTTTSKQVPAISSDKAFTFVKPKTPPKPGEKPKPVPPPRPNKVPDKNVTLKETGEKQTAIMSNPSKTVTDRSGSCSNQSTSSSNQDQIPKRFSSLSAGAAVTFKDQCDGDAVIKNRSPAPASTVRSHESRNSAHSDNFLKPLCATNNLSTSVGFLVEKKHSPVPKPRAEKQLKEKSKEVIPRRQLHRSHSDLSSCRHSRTSSDFSDLSSRISRTSTEVERFFNEMGIDRTILDPMLNLHGKQNDYLDSFSSLDSQEARSVSSRISYGGDLEQVPAESEQDLMERSTTVTSVVERNARIIKWLCNVKKAKVPNTSGTPNTSGAPNTNGTPNTSGTPKQNKVANV